MSDFATKIFLTGGSGRSGSNILRKVIGRHPDVAEVPQEWRFTIDPDGLVDFYTTFQNIWSPILFDIKLKRLRKLLEGIEKYGPLARLYRDIIYKSQLPRISPFNLDVPFGSISATDYCPNYRKIVNEFLTKLTRFKYRARWTGSPFLSKNEMCYASPFDEQTLAKMLGDFFRNIAFDVAQAQGRHCYIENNTWYPLFIDKFLDLVPEAKLISIYRDPRDVISSYISRNYTPKTPVQAAYYYKDIIKSWERIKKRIPDHAFLEISLEQMIDNPEEVTRRICDFLEIPWHENLLKAPLHRNSTQRWKRDLTADDIDKIQLVIKRELYLYGYDL